MYTFWRTAACGALLTFSAACQKNDLAPQLVVDTNPAALRSEWVWVASTGGLSGGTVTPAPGRQETWVFRSDGTLTEYHNGQAVYTSTYARATETTLLYHDQREVITLNPGANQPDGRYIIEKLNDKELVLQDDFPDGYRRSFRRGAAVALPGL